MIQPTDPTATTTTTSAQTTAAPVLLVDRTPAPESIAELARAVAAFAHVSVTDLVVADHTHEELSPGAYSIALEASGAWPSEFQEAVYSGSVTTPAGWWLECLTSWAIAAYPTAG